MIDRIIDDALQYVSTKLQAGTHVQYNDIDRYLCDHPRHIRNSVISRIMSSAKVFGLHSEQGYIRCINQEIEDIKTHTE